MVEEVWEQLISIKLTTYQKKKMEYGKNLESNSFVSHVGYLDRT